MDGKTYRVCRQCGEEWNVAVTDKGGKVYLCPLCLGEPWYASKPWLSSGRIAPGDSARSYPAAKGRLDSTGRPPRGGEGHRRKTLDQSGPGGGAGGQSGDL